jgi:hypothetical protein
MRTFTNRLTSIRHGRYARGAVLGIVAAGALCIALLPHVARAGTKNSYPVTITGTPGAFVVTGSVGSARNSADANQTIGCRLTTTASGYSTNCRAVDSAGTVRQCSNTNVANFFYAVMAINDRSLLQIEGADGGACTRIDVDNGSTTAVPQN